MNYISGKLNHALEYASATILFACLAIGCDQSFLKKYDFVSNDGKPVHTEVRGVIRGSKPLVKGYKVIIGTLPNNILVEHNPMHLSYNSNDGIPDVSRIVSHCQNGISQYAVENGKCIIVFYNNCGPLECEATIQIAKNAVKGALENGADIK
jgi:hypothetical protein